GDHRTPRDRTVRPAGGCPVFRLGDDPSETGRAGGLAAPGAGLPSAGLSLRLYVGRPGGRGGGRLRRLVGVGDHGATQPEWGHAVQPVQRAELRGAGAPSVEDTAGGAAGVLEIARARRSVGLPDAVGVDGVSIAGAVLPPERARRGRRG